MVNCLLYINELLHCLISEKLLDCKDVNKILNFHNEIRQQVASGETSLKQAKDMWVLVSRDSNFLMQLNLIKAC